jgi:hypothetical protein
VLTLLTIITMPAKRLQKFSSAFFTAVAEKLSAQCMSLR